MSLSDEFEGTCQAVLICSNEDAIQLAKGVFDTENYDTLTWEVGKPCSIVEESPPAVILVDADAAHGDPLALCREIRRMPGCDYIPLILLSNDDDASALRRLTPYLASGRCSRPFRPAVPAGRSAGWRPLRP